MANASEIRIKVSNRDSCRVAFSLRVCCFGIKYVWRFMQVVFKDNGFMIPDLSVPKHGSRVGVLLNKLIFLIQVMHTLREGKGMTPKFPTFDSIIVTVNENL